MEIEKEPLKQKNANVIDKFKRCATHGHFNENAIELAKIKWDSNQMIGTVKRAIRAQTI
jgi:hypothetical protein